MSVLDSVEMHPNVVSQNLAISQQQLQTKGIQSSTGPIVNFSTSGNLLIDSKLNTNLYRAATSSRAYLDGLISAKIPLYDFGQADARISSSIFLENSAKLQYDDAKEAMLQKLLDLTVEASRLQSIEVLLKNDNIQTNKHLAEARTLFQAGVITIEQVRTIQLAQLNTESELHLLAIKQKETLDNLKKEFLITTEVQEIFALIQDLISSQKNKKQGLLDLIEQNSTTALSARTTSKTQEDINALQQQIFSIEAAKKPQIEGTLTATLYDITRNIEEYQVSGGLNVALPLFDSGLSAVQIQSAIHNIDVENEKLRGALFEKQLALVNLIQKANTLKSRHSSNLIKKDEMNAKLVNLELSRKISQNNFAETLQTQLEINALKRELLNYDYMILQANIMYLRLNESLLGAFTELNKNKLTAK